MAFDALFSLNSLCIFIDASIVITDASMANMNFMFSQSADTQSEPDRFDEMLGPQKDPDADFPHSDFPPSTAQIINSPTNICAETMLGKMPTSQKILSSNHVERLTSKYEWKPVRAVLTAAGLYVSRPNEDSIRDLIPLFEVTSLKRIHEIPSDNLDLLSSPSATRNVNLSSLFDGSSGRAYVVMLQTVDGGFNSGRTYYFAAQTEEEGQAWEEAIRSTVDHAVQSKLAGPGLISRVQLLLRRSVLCAQHMHSPRDRPDTQIL
jgi:hypothetical protein